MEKSGDQQQSLNGQMKIESVERRNANYKPNIWNYGLLQSLTNKYDKKEKGKIKIKKSHSSRNPPFDATTTTTIRFLPFSRRQHYYNHLASIFYNYQCRASKSQLQSNLYFRIQMVEPKFGAQIRSCIDGDYNTRKVAMLRELNYIILGSHDYFYFFYILLSKCHFGLYSAHMQYFKFNAQINKIYPFVIFFRWWRDLDLLETLIFTRDRAVESFLWAVGIVSEPQHESLRKWLTIVLVFIMIIDDVYDIYGSIEELECFTRAVNRWNHTEIQQLPEAIRRCFFALYDTTNDMDLQIRHEKGWNSVLSYLKKGWADFCQALHVEAKWYHTGHTPRLWEYLDNGWISSSGPLLSLVVLFGVGQDITKTIEILENNQEIIYHSSLIIRLCNDQATSAVIILST
ncbi:alpha-farnesene synthase-like [Olea europaea subsp. europaea]|uniref:Alpha-farnesene synthase-like n=1 Tax=Olea europaea subsp. europaea TaxID=158383 RepID=A0A8S0QI00_OLEEU|nr:alpha-farnesene synthase-like [Olea europaea subsp. europaea]